MSDHLIYVTDPTHTAALTELASLVGDQVFSLFGFRYAEQS